MPIAPKSLVLDLMSTLPAGSAVPVGALVRAGAILGVGDNSLRVALARMRAQGLVETAGRGHYRLGTAATAIDSRVRGWYALEDEVGPWDGSWLAVEAPTGGQSRDRHRMLRLLGLRPLTEGLLVRPANLVDGTESVRTRLCALDRNDSTTVFRMTDLDDATDARARGLWDVEALHRGYAETIERLADSTERLPGMEARDAMAESFLLGGEAVRVIVSDPLLPAPIADVEARRALVAAMRAYHKLGLSLWRDWAGDTVTLEQSPTDVWRHTASAGHTPAAGG